MSEPSTDLRAAGGVRFSPWNLFLLVPFLLLVTPWTNTAEPRLFGMPFFYWIQFAFVPVGVLCVAVVYLRTRDAIELSAEGRPVGMEVVTTPEAGGGTIGGVYVANAWAESGGLWLVTAAPAASSSSARPPVSRSRSTTASRRTAKRLSGGRRRSRSCS